MANSVVYADLKFAAGPPPAAPAAPEEDDSPYENVALGPVPAAPTPGRWPRRWPRRWGVPAGVLAAGLLLLLVATVTLGACYWQVTRRMQDTSREHAAEQGRLSQEVSTREQSLEQTQLELAQARAELQRAWQEGNGSRLELESLSRELRRVTGVLGRTEQELQEVQGKLNNSKSTVAALRACVNTDCCPQGWVLYRSKCLFISMQKNNWYNSDRDCKMKSAQLLVKDHWPSWTVPHFLQAWGAIYWIGESYQNHHEGLDKKIYNE
ncbi:B-cell differentiation antigen CD72-like [Aegotheles albertisi]